MTTHSASEALRYGLGKEFLKLYAVTLAGFWLFLAPVSEGIRPVSAFAGVFVPQLRGPLTLLFSVVGVLTTVAGFALFAGGIVGNWYRLHAA